jgi:hypothetical protein
MFTVDNKNNKLLPYLMTHELCYAIILLSTAKLSEPQYVVRWYVLVLYPPLEEYERERESEVGERKGKMNVLRSNAGTPHTVLRPQIFYREEQS